MDAATRHWYLQQMGVPVWLPKGDSSTEAQPPLAVTETAKASQPNALEKRQSVSADVEVGLSPAQALVESLRSGAPAPAAVEAPIHPIWLVMPHVDASDKAAAQSLLENILKAVNVELSQCELFWQLPSELPPAGVKYLWCFGIQPPPQTTSKGIVLPAISQMLNDVSAKRQAWGQLKAAMPFVL